MTPQIILYIILAISLISFLFDLILELLNLKAQRKEIPAEIASFYDPEKYLKSLDYTNEQTKFGFFKEGFGLILSVSILVMGGFGWLDSFLRNYISQEIPLALVFFGIIMILSDIITLPFQLYDTFVLEEKYGFNKTSIKTFLIDKLKGYALGSIIGGLLITVLLYLIQSIGPNFWVWFALIAIALIFLVNMFYSSIILPLFNKLTPLEEGELKTNIEVFAKKVNFPLDNILVMDGSKRSNKANAFFSGIGKKKKIVLFDTLIKNHTNDEIVAVLAHEVGHFKKKHIVYGFILSAIQIVFTLYILSLMVFNQNLSIALGGTQQALHLNLIAFGILFSPISGITGLLMSLYSRKNEFEADAYAKQTFDGHSLSRALKRLSVDSLSNLYPHPYYVFFHYSHPPLLQRLQALCD